MSTMEKPANKVSFLMKDLPVDKVVVFKDRAEVCRSIKTQLNPGDSELKITGISNHFDTDSIRVEGRGQASVLDVVCEKKWVTEQQDETSHEKVKEIKNKLVELRDEFNKIKSHSDRLKKQQAVLNEFAASLSKPSINGNEKSQASDNIGQFMDFLDRYGTKMELLDIELEENKKKEIVLTEEINVNTNNLRKIERGSSHHQTEITILVQTLDHAECNHAHIHLTYVVYNASWTPKYDIRVFGDDQDMTINYFGIITQSTGEDWNDTKLSLSTAQPSVGGNLPKLGTLNVKIEEKIVTLPRTASRQAFGGAMNFNLSKCVARDEMADMKCAAPEIEHMTANVQQSSVGSTSTFEIPRSATIPSDNNSHKVSIGIIKLKPQFVYESVPKKNTHAYIKSKVVNSSEYLMIGGEANVFFDNNFVSKTQLKSYSPQEEFECSLGIDSAIRVDYKPAKVFKSQTGLITKSTLNNHVQNIEVKNTKDTTIKIKIVDQLPLSSDERVQVKLIEPLLKNNQDARLNKDNNIEFDLELKPLETKDIVIKYTIEHPNDQKIEFNE